MVTNNEPREDFHNNVFSIVEVSSYYQLEPMACTMLTEDIL